MLSMDFEGSELRHFFSWLCLVLITTLSVGDPLASVPCGPPDAQGRMVFSAKAFHQDFAPSDIQCFDLCWTVASCHAASYNTESRLCRLYHVGDVANATFLTSSLELYVVMTRPVCKPFEDPCIMRLCDEGTQCQPVSEDQKICTQLDAQPIEGTCPVVPLPSDVRVSYMGNTPGTSATINCPVSMTYTGNENITCMYNAVWDQQPGRCVFYIWKHLSVPWLQSIPRGSLIHGRCLEVIGHSHPKKWFDVSLQARSSQSCVLRLQSERGVWTINSRYGRDKWGNPERTSKKQPFQHNKPINLTICFGETFKLYGQGDLFATYGQKMNPDSITHISVKDLDLEEVIIRADDHGITMDASGNAAGTFEDLVTPETTKAVEQTKQMSSSSKIRTTWNSLGKHPGAKENRNLNQDSATGKKRDGSPSSVDDLQDYNMLDQSLT